MEPIDIKVYKNGVEVRALHTQKESPIQRDFFIVVC